MSKKQKTEFSVTISERMDEADLYSPACTGALAESAQVIVEQNRWLLLRSQERSFNPVTELDFTSNGAGLALQHLFEEVAVFREGCVPWRILRELFVTTDSLINALKQRKNAPVLAIDAVGVAFRECAIVWCDTHSPPRMERETYLKKVFKGKDEFCKALKALHAEYVRIAAAKGHKKRTMSAASILEEQSGGDERLRIYREILRLENGGMTVKKAISAMMHGTYAARMRDVKPETWRRYFNDWRRHRVMDVKASVDKNHTSVEKSVDKSKVSVDKSVEKKMSVDKTCENVCAILKANPRATLDQVAKTMKLSVRGVEQAVKRLKNAGHLRKVGGKKLGYWEVF